jgi:hypothetical protein
MSPLASLDWLLLNYRTIKRIGSADQTLMKLRPNLGMNLGMNSITAVKSEKNHSL